MPGMVAHCLSDYLLICEANERVVFFSLLIIVLYWVLAAVFLLFLSLPFILGFH